jgi:succinyl-CoA synthetase beta subunit
MAMKLYEYMGKELFKKFDIPVPRGIIVNKLEDVPDEINGMNSFVVKTQVLTGGRGKAGGIKFAENKKELKDAVSQLLSNKIKGFNVKCLLVEEKIDIDRELYFSITINKKTQKIMLMASNEGGVEIENVNDELIYKYDIDFQWGLQQYTINNLAKKLNLDKELSKQFNELCRKLFKLYTSYDCELVEINPLVITTDKKIIAADSKINIDDEAVYKHPDLPIVDERSGIEKTIADLGMTCVELDGDIAIIANGAGLGMGTLDSVKELGGDPANFMDTSVAGTNSEKMAKAMGTILQRNPKGLLVNIFGGLAKADDVARGLLKYLKEESISIPLVIRLSGTNEEAAIELLTGNNIPVFTKMSEAVAEIVKQVSERR